MATSYVYLSHTLLLSKIQTFRRAKNRAGKEVEMHPKVRELVQEVRIMSTRVWVPNPDLAGCGVTNLFLGVPHHGVPPG